MGHHQTSRSGKRPSFMKNARSFFIKLVHSQHASSNKADEPSQDEMPKVEPHQEEAAAETTTNLPPAYEIAMQTPSQQPDNVQTDAPDDLQERLIRSTTERKSVMSDNTSDISSSPSSYTHLPLSPIRPSFVLPTPRRPEETEEMELLSDRRSLRPSSSRQSCITNNPRPSKRAVTHKSMKATSTGSLNSPRNASNGRSGTRRDRELIAAKKSLPILTKFGKPSTSQKNVPRF